MRIRKRNQLSQLNIYIKDLSWLHLHDESRKASSGGPIVYILVFVAYLTIPSSSEEHQCRHGNDIPCMVIW